MCVSWTSARFNVQITYSLLQMNNIYSHTDTQTRVQITGSRPEHLSTEEVYKIYDEYRIKVLFFEA